MGKQYSLGSSTILIIVLTSIGYCVSFIAQLIIAAYFGIGKELDSFVVASVIPEFFFGIANVILVTSFIILFPEIQKNYDTEGQRKFVNTLFTLACIFFGMCMIGILLFSSTIAEFIAPGFTVEQQELTSTMLKILAISTFFLGLNSLYTGILYHEQHFFAPKLLRIIISLALVVSIVTLSQHVGIMSLAIGTTAGIIISCIIQYGFIHKKEYSFSFSLEFNQNIRELFILSLPILITAFLFYLNKVIINMIASTTEIGSVSILNYAFLIVNVPVIFFSESLATPLFSFLRKKVTNEEIPEVKTTFLKSIMVLISIVVPIMILFIIFHYEIIHMLLERGAFTAASTEAVSSTLVFYAVGLIPLSLISIIGAVLHALKKMKQRMYTYFFIFSCNIIFAYVFAKLWSYRGIALGTSISYWIVIPIAFYYTLNLLGEFDMRGIFLECIKILFASSVIAMLLYYIHYVFTKSIIFFSDIRQLILFVTVCCVSIFAYWILLRLMKSKSEEIIMALVKRSLKNG